MFSLLGLEIVFKEMYKVGTFATMRLLQMAFIIYTCLLTNSAFCQVQDSIGTAQVFDSSLAPITDTNFVAKDSLVESESFKKEDTTTYAVAAFHPQLPLKSDPVFLIQKAQIQKDQDILFYCLVGLVLYLGIIRLAFPKYLQDLFLVIFQPRFKQSQTSDMLQQSVAPAFFMNIFFVITFGLFVSSVLTIKRGLNFDFWFLSGISCLSIAATYFTKYIFLNLSSWVLQVQSSVKKYLFIVMQLNKLLAMFLLPVIWFISFGQAEQQSYAVEIALVMVVLTILLRYFLSFAVLKKDLSFQFLHILIYVLAIEIIPLLMIYKVGVQFLDRTL